VNQLMLSKDVPGPRGSRGAKVRRGGAAAVEFACCLPLVIMILAGLWQVGRITEVQVVVWNSAREAARDASLGQDNLSTVASNLLTYLQGAEKTAFGAGHSTSMISPVVSLPANTTGYTCWDNTKNQELFTITFSDLTDTSTTDPTTMDQLDLYQIGVQVPYSSIAWSSLVPIPGTTRLSVAVVWASMVDSPFQLTPTLPAQ
jgi:Flp pilus assembly protein TadG